ncbi:hypothetical protein ACF0H5_019887 [Mactra antiquata]
MVFLTFVRNASRYTFRGVQRKYVETSEPSRLMKRHQMKRVGAKYYGRLRNCWIIGVNIMNKALRYSTRDTACKSEKLDKLYSTRLEAACLEHGMDQKYFLTSLAEFDINLNRESLANLAIYEPRTFQTLVEFVKKRSLEIGLQSKTLGAPMGLEPRGILEEIKKASNSSSS